MIRVAVIGKGHTGRAALHALKAAPDFDIAGVVYHKAAASNFHLAAETSFPPIVEDIGKLGQVDVALLCVPSRAMPNIAEDLLRRGIHTVDSFDIHAEIPALRTHLDAVAKESGKVAVVSSGWDPGSDSIVRALFQALSPSGITYTDFGPGMSLGHSTAARAVAGVKDALSVTIPKGTGLHRRMVYIELAPGADFESVRSLILADPYFASDESYVVLADNVEHLRSAGHGVHITRSGGGGDICNQRLSFTMAIDNPALTAFMMVASARAALRQLPGAYTLIEIPVIDFLPGTRESWVRALV